MMSAVVNLRLDIPDIPICMQISNHADRIKLLNPVFCKGTAVFALPSYPIPQAKAFILGIGCTSDPLPQMIGDTIGCNRIPPQTFSA